MNNIQNLFDKHKQTILICLCFMILGLAFFGSALTYPFFIFDDFDHIAQNPQMPAQNLSDLFFFWKNSSTPLIYNFWQLLAFFSGTEAPYLFRFTNILFHGFNAALVIFLVKELYPRVQFNILFLLGTIFLIHPLQVESIVWISSSRGVISTTFFLLAILSYLRYRKNEQRFVFLTLALFLISVLIKPSTLIFPFLLLAIERYYFTQTFKECFQKMHFYFYPAVGLGLVHINDLLTLDFGNIDGGIRIIHSLEAFHHYFLKTFIPLDLKFNYGLTFLKTTVTILNPTQLLIPTLSLSIFVFCLTNLLTMRKKYHWCLWMICFSVGIFPTLGLIPFDFQNFSTVADRYHYLALIFFVLFLGSFLEKASKSFIIALSLFLFASCILTLNRTYQWSNQSELILSGQELKDAPTTVFPALALAFSQQKDCDSIHEMIKLSPDDHTDLLTAFFHCLLNNQNHQLARDYFIAHYTHLADPEILLLRGRVHLMINNIDGFFYDLRQLSYLSVEASQKLLHFLPQDQHALHNSFVPHLKHLFSTTLFHHQPDWAASLILWLKNLNQDEYQDLIDEMSLNLQNYRQLTR